MQKRGPWKITSTSVPYETPWMKVIEDKVTTPTGGKGQYSYVEFKHGSTILPLDEQGNVYLGREFHYAIGQYDLEAPSGGLDGNESSLACAKRELKEELGILAAKWTPLGFINPFTATVYSTSYLFLARKLSFTLSNQEETEQITMVKIPFKKAVQMALDSKIHHGPTCVLLLRANEYLRHTEQ